MKLCWKCGCEKPLDEFGTDRSRHDGKNPRCKPCMRAASAESARKNPEARKAANAKYREENREKCNAAVKRWFEQDKEHALTVRRNYAEKNRVAVRGWKAKWNSANPEYIRVAKATRRAAGAVRTSDIQKLLVLQRRRCAHCSTSLRGGYHVDHVTPVKRGGNSDRLNLQLLCPPCNRRKGAKDPYDFARESGRLL
jgi:5-methylcytosine-specific restriction endonuclease McrA